MGEYEASLCEGSEYASGWDEEIYGEEMILSSLQRTLLSEVAVLACGEYPLERQVTKSFPPQH